MANDTTTSLLADRTNYERIDTAKTLAAGDCGVTQNVVGSLTLTLPSTVVGYNYRIRNAGGLVNSSGPKGAVSDGKVTITVAPASVDQIIGLGLTAADNKAWINTSGNVGDQLDLIADGVNGWMAGPATKGVWTRAA